MAPSPLKSSQTGCGVVWQNSFTDDWIPLKLCYDLHRFEETCSQDFFHVADVII